MCRYRPETLILLLAILFCLLSLSFEQFEMSYTRSNSKLPRATKTQKMPDRNSTEHNYVKQGGSKNGVKPKTNTQTLNQDESYTDDNSENSFSLLSESETAPCHNCEKLLPKSSEGVCCNFCEHWYCLKCSHLKKMIYQALKGSPDSLMWFCEHCLTAFPGVKKVMIQIGSLEDKYEKLDERVTSLETQPKEIENISEIVREEVKELQDIESRKLHMVCFNLPESESSDPDERKSDDTNSLKSLIHEDMKLYDKNIEIENPVRLGKKIEKTQSVAGSNTNKTGDRPLRFKVWKFEDKRVILQANSELKNSSDENVKKIFITPDQTRRQREESFKLREELRYRKRVKNEKNLKISRGRIVSVEQSNDTDTETSNNGRGYTGTRVFNSRTFTGGSGAAVNTGPSGFRPSQGEK